MICSSGLVCFLLGCLEGNENSQDRESLLHFFFSKNLDCFGGPKDENKWVLCFARIQKSTVGYTWLWRN